MHTRENALHQWLKTIYPSKDFTLTPLAGDASFRRYYRLQHQMLSQIVMDAPPAKIALTPFVHIAEFLASQGIKTPQIHAIDYQSGFALLEDFGNILFSDAAKEQQSTVDLYQSAIQLLCQLQQSKAQNINLPQFDRAFMFEELALFQEWFLERYLGIKLNHAEQSMLQQTFEQMVEVILQQPQVLIHRDYHSRNIMLPSYSSSKNSLTMGLIDFQDAMIGPITYDLVSLLKDCYIRIPAELMNQSLKLFFENAALPKGYGFDNFLQAFDCCGMQRHLKILGIFCRLNFRDGKPNYLANLPLTFEYLLSSAQAYPEFATFYNWLNERVQQPFLRQFQ